MTSLRDRRLDLRTSLPTAPQWAALNRLVRSLSARRGCATFVCHSVTVKSLFSRVCFVFFDGLREASVEMRVIIFDECVRVLLQVSACLDPVPGRRPEAKSLRTTETWP